LFRTWSEPFTTWDLDHPSHTLGNTTPGLKNVMLLSTTMPFAGASPPTSTFEPLGLPASSPLLKLAFPATVMLLSKPSVASVYA